MHCILELYQCVVMFETMFGTVNVLDKELSKKPKNANLISANQETIYLGLSVIPVKIPLCVCIFEKKKKKTLAYSCIQSSC